MTCLPFGLAAAPRMFATITNWTAEVLRSKGMRLVVYLDDYLICHQNRNLLQVQTKTAISFLSSLGWTVNLEKSIVSPTRSLDYLGISWDTQHNTKSLPQEKIDKIYRCLTTRLAAGNWTLKQAQRLLGCLNFATFVTPRGRLHCRSMQRQSNLLRNTPHKQSLYSEEVRLELQWWLENVAQKSPIHQECRQSNYIITDASDVKWGAIVNDKKLQGRWNTRQRYWHCNQKEIYAVIAAISEEAVTLANSTVILQCDNRTVVSYIRNEGGTKSHQLQVLTKDLLSLVDKLNIVLIPHHIPGVYNTEADHLSRNRSNSEWHLLDGATSKIFKRWGTPSIDLFASEIAHVVSNYVTLDLLDSNAYYHNAFSRCWNYDLAWVFPPPGLIPRVLQHLNTAMGHFILITPKWKRPFWRTDVKRRALTRPIKIRDLQTSLIDTATGRSPTHINNLRLEAWYILGGMH
ncbi:uncharacterized protein LOC119190097 [Manduca sexta]|uniref:uncharacterized protein LOC119190097 n=1 Tax=Manduca sexta TaxID=7130 RepID=UPI00188E4B72|nr:uncharacterized protein LOC119190097 [Manduca sexta]